MSNIIRDTAHRFMSLWERGADAPESSGYAEFLTVRRTLLESTGSTAPAVQVAREIMAQPADRYAYQDPESLRVGDTVAHTDGDGSTGTLTGVQAYPLVTVRWESTGQESTENRYYLTFISR